MRVALAAMFIALLGLAEANACSIFVPSHEVDPKAREIDETAPGAPALIVESIRRGHAPTRSADGTVSATSCDDIGFITFRIVDVPADDHSSAAEIGYRFELVEGPAPDGLVPRHAILGADGKVVLHWIDGATDDQERLDFIVQVVAIDRAGNEGPPSSPIRVRD